MRNGQPLWETLLEVAGGALVIGLIVISVWRWLVG
jgi:hypothetical protein